MQQPSFIVFQILTVKIFALYDIRNRRFESKVKLGTACSVRVYICGLKRYFGVTVPRVYNAVKAYMYVLFYILHVALCFGLFEICTA